VGRRVGEFAVAAGDESGHIFAAAREFQQSPGGPDPSGPPGGSGKWGRSPLTGLGGVSRPEACQARLCQIPSPRDANFRLTRRRRCAAAPKLQQEPFARLEVLGVDRHPVEDIVGPTFRLGARWYLWGHVGEATAGLDGGSSESLRDGGGGARAPGGTDSPWGPSHRSPCSRAGARGGAVRASSRPGAV
jgi:hypothetical protein